MIIFTIAFHRAFHVGAGETSDGVDRRVDPDNLLPATSLKGLLRAALIERLGIPESRVREIFGAAGRQPATWRWTDATGFVDAAIQPTTRVSIDDATGTASDQLLMFGEEVDAQTATFIVEPAVMLEPDRERDDELLLWAAALAVSALGGGRRRGSGWVTITANGREWTAEHTRRLISMRGAR